MPVRIERCHYCSNPAEYNQLVGEDKIYTVTGVCKDHLEMGLTS